MIYYNDGRRKKEKIIYISELLFHNGKLRVRTISIVSNLYEPCYSRRPPGLHFNKNRYNFPQLNRGIINVFYLNFLFLNELKGESL